MVMPSLSHQTESFGQVEQGIGTGKRNTIVRADRPRQAPFDKELLEALDCGVFARRLEGLAQQQEA